MPGRNAKPAALHIAEGNPNRLTKAQLEARQAGEVKLGRSDLDKIKPPAFVKNDPIAFSHWKQLIKEYKAAAEQKIELLKSSDIDVLAMYCKTHSEYERLIVQYQRIENIVIDEHILDEYISRAEEVDEVNYKALRYLSQLASVEGILKIETAINKKMDMLIKMQDRLFLNPLAKVKNVAKPKEDKKPGKFERFNNRSG